MIMVSISRNGSSSKSVVSAFGAICLLMAVIFPIAAVSAPESNSGAAESLVDQAVEYMKFTGPSCNPDRIKALVKKGLDVDASVDGSRLLTLAVGGGAHECALVFLENGASVHYKVRDRPFLNVALTAATWGPACDPDLIRALIERGAKPNDSATIWGRTPLAQAALEKYIGCARALVQAGAEVNPTGKGLSSFPLLTAQIDTRTKPGQNQESELRVKMTKLLLRHGANPDHALKEQQFRSGFSGFTALYVSVVAFPRQNRTACAACARILIAAGANPNHISQSGQTPLLWALAPAGALDDTHATTLKAVKALVSGGARVDLANPETGKTPLMLAALQGYEKIVRYLLNQGADVTVEDVKGKSAIDYARKAHRRQIVQLLKRRMPS